MLKKATYHWYNTINETMKDTMAHIHDIQPMPTLLMYGTKDLIVDTRQLMSLKKNIKHLNYILKLGKVLPRGSQ